jgi:hypothetical protein
LKLSGYCHRFYDFSPVASSKYGIDSVIERFANIRIIGDRAHQSHTASIASRHPASDQGGRVYQEARGNTFL